MRATAVCLVLLAVGTRGQSQSVVDGQLAHFLPGPVAGLSDQPPPWQPSVPGTPLWSWGPPGCSWNAGLGDHCVGYATSVVTLQYFVTDSGLVRQMVAVQPKLQAAQDRMMKGFQEGRMPTPEENAQVGQLTHLQDSLKREARFVTLSIKTNAAPHVVAMGDSQVGSIQGRPLYWRASGGVAATLSVFVAPTGFTLGPSPDGKPHSEVKCVLVTADFRQRDETLTRALLQSVNYAGLAGLVQP
ncbi:MAG TPA: hypothetical protein VN848_07005 [Gemmatimonadales bacterium]|nr:hypothetical protein [Gemmatimonadales bacterium]